MLFLKIYIAINIFVALVNILIEGRYEKFIMNTPSEDVEFFESQEPTPVLVWVIFPGAFLIRAAWRTFCRTVNAIIERF